jgi:hypothetical protein
MPMEPSCRLRVGDPVRLKDSSLDLRGDVWHLRTGRYVVVQWQDACRSTHAESAIEYDTTRVAAHHRAPAADR